MKNGNEMPASILANVEVFDYLKEKKKKKVGERKTRTEAYADLLDKSLAGFVSPFLRKVDYELRPCQCHVTVSDLASEWHWHRATVRSFLDTLEALGQLERTRLTKSVVITMPLQTGHPADSRNVQETPGLADQLRAVLSDWVIGKAELDDIGYECERLVRQAMTETGVPGICPKPDNFSSVNLAASDDERAVRICTIALGCIAHAAMQRALRKRRFDNGSEFWKTSVPASTETGRVSLKFRDCSPSIFSIPKRRTTISTRTTRRFSMRFPIPSWRSPRGHRRRRTRPETANRMYNPGQFAFGPLRESCRL